MPTAGELDAKARVHTLADKLSEINAKTLGYTLGHLDSEALLNALAHTLADVRVEKPADILYDVKSLGTGERAWLDAKH